MNKVKRELMEKLENKGFEVVVNEHRLLVITDNERITILNNEVEKFLKLI